MIAKKILAPKGGGRTAVLMRYVVNAQGAADPRSWAATAGYILDADGAENSTGEKVSAVRITNCVSDDPATATMEIEALQSKYKGRSKAAKTYHLVFSFPPGEHPPQAVLHDIEDELCKSIGMQDHQRISAVHIDRDHYHVHVAINSVTPDGKRLISSPSHEKRNLMRACAAMELKHGLITTNHGLEKESNFDRDREQGNRPDNPADDTITPKQIPKPDTAFRRYLRKCHDTEFTGGQRNSEHGMHDMPGSGLVYDADRSAVLLSDNALANVDEGTAPDHPSLRRSDSGDRGDVGPAGITAVAMETKAGIETLAGYVSRELAPAIRDAAVWQEVHDALADHGLIIKKRGAGLVIGDEGLGIWCKASSANRDFSLTGLEKALGAFVAPMDSPPQAKAQYAVKPLSADGKEASAKLYERYQADRRALGAQRQSGLEAIRRQHAKSQDEIKKWVASQRVVRRMTTKGARKRLSGMAATAQAKAAKKAAAEQAAIARAALMKVTSAQTWNDWLKSKAEAGDPAALNLLRVQQERHDRTLGGLFSPDRTDRVAARLLQDKSRTIRPNGSVEYRAADGGTVVDHAGRITIPRNTPGACLLALEVMKEKFPGQSLALSGESAMAQTIAALAGQEGINVTFSDERLELIRTGTAQLKNIKKPLDGVRQWIESRNDQRGKISLILEHRELKGDDAGRAIFAGRRTMKDMTEVLLFEQNQQIIVKMADTEDLQQAAGWAIGLPVELVGTGHVKPISKGRKK